MPFFVSSVTFLLKVSWWKGRTGASSLTPLSSFSVEKTDKLAQMRQEEESSGGAKQLRANANECTLSRRGAEAKSGVCFLLLPVFADVTERLFMLLSKGSKAGGAAIWGESNPRIQT